MADIPLDPRLQAQLLDLYSNANHRIASTQPIHDAAMAMATRLAPGYARAAMGPVPQPSAPLTTGSSSSGGSSVASRAAMAGLASLLAGGPGSGGNLANLINGLKKLFTRNNPNNWPLQPGDGFGGDHTSTFGGRDPFADVLPSYDPGFNDPNLFTGMPSDPSRGTGVGPGMQGYRQGGDPNEQDNTDYWNW